MPEEGQVTRLHVCASYITTQAEARATQWTKNFSFFLFLAKKPGTKAIEM